MTSWPDRQRPAAVTLPNNFADRQALLREADISAPASLRPPAVLRSGHETDIELVGRVYAEQYGTTASTIRRVHLHLLNGVSVT
jgi:hypothetical protein